MNQLQEWLTDEVFWEVVQCRNSRLAAKTHARGCHGQFRSLFYIS